MRCIEIVRITGGFAASIAAINPTDAQRSSGAQKLLSQYMSAAWATTRPYPESIADRSRPRGHRKTCMRRRSCAGCGSRQFRRILSRVRPPRGTKVPEANYNGPFSEGVVGFCKHFGIFVPELLREVLCQMQNPPPSAAARYIRTAHREHDEMRADEGKTMTNDDDPPVVGAVTKSYY